VSENDNVTAQALQKLYSKCHGNERLKRKAFRRLRKTDKEGADVTCWGRLFQVRAAATGKAIRQVSGVSPFFWTHGVYLLFFFSASVQASSISFCFY